MGTFYHRLPLLNPGLLGTGYGMGNSFVVMDTGSLAAPYHGEVWSVWPAAKASGVARKYVPELPNPIPGENQNSWGYPITLHAFFGNLRGSPPIEMSLHLGSDQSGKLISCHFITPATNRHPRFSPENAYALIPKSSLKAKQEYTVVARCKELSKELIWTFTTGSK